jgi:hypothetical protein
MTTRPRGPAAKQIIPPKHNCVADPNTMMRASQQAPIYYCRIRGCGKLVYSNGSPVSIDDYNMQIALAMIKENKPPVFWLCFDLKKGVKLLGAYSNSKRAMTRLQKKFGKSYNYSTTKGIIGVTKGKESTGIALRIKVNVDMNMEV